MSSVSKKKKAVKKTLAVKYPSLALVSDLEYTVSSKDEAISVLKQLKTVFKKTLAFFERRGKDAWTQGVFAVPKKVERDEYGNVINDTDGHRLKPNQIKCVCLVGAMQNVHGDDVEDLLSVVNLDMDDLTVFNDNPTRKFPQIKSALKRFIKDTDKALVEVKEAPNFGASYDSTYSL